MDPSLIEACTGGNIGDIRSLVEKGVKVDRSLIIASHKHIETMKFLLDNGVNIEEKDIRGDTLLIHASWSGRYEMLRVLIEKGANIEAKDSYGNTPLINASMTRSYQNMYFLLENGADIKVRNNNGNTFTSFLDHDQKRKVEEFMKDIEERKKLIKPSLQ